LSSRSSEPPVEEGATETRSLEFLSEPGRVTVTLRNLETEERFQEVTPATFSVPPGRYQWNAEKDGFESTSANNPVDLRSRQQEVVRLELSPARTAAPAYVQNGNRAYENENYDEAIQYYRQVSPPEDGGKATWYVQTLGRLGEMYWKERQDYAQAIDAYESILDHDPTRYAAHLNLARIAYELDNYTQALRRLDQVDRLRYQIPVDRRTEVSLHARHLRASVLYQQTANAESRRRTVQVGPRALQTLRSFIEAVPSDMEADFQDQLQDAQEKLEEVRTILRTTN
jgi:tetratricopeptide (TPR) repeat protein